MSSVKERLLDGLLAILVLMSLVLSSRVWFPSNQTAGLDPRQPLVQFAPPALQPRMPDIFRPERIVIRRADGTAGTFQTGSVDYLRLWNLTQTILARLRPFPLPMAPENPETETVERETILLTLPIALRLSDWAEHWSWTAVGPVGQSPRLDRIVFELGRSPGIYMVGIDSALVRLGPLSELEQKALKDLIREMPAKAFIPQRPLNAKELPVRIAPDLQVPDLRLVQRVQIRPLIPSAYVEEARFFPDLSVVREITESTAQSFTDGQRLLRLASSGVLEYTTANGAGVSPDLPYALRATDDWVASHGGWPQELVLTGYSQLPGRTRLHFDLRLEGPYPIESADGALQVDLTSVDRVVYYRRYPAFPELSFQSEQTLLVTPEEALRIAAEETSLFLFETVREIHPGYLLQPEVKTGSWSVLPSWVFTVGDRRVYVPAEINLQNRRPVVIR